MFEAFAEIEYITTCALPFSHQLFDERMNSNFDVSIIATAVFGLGAVVFQDTMLQFLHVVKVNGVYTHQAKRQYEAVMCQEGTASAMRLVVHNLHKILQTQCSYALLHNLLRGFIAAEWV